MVHSIGTQKLDIEYETIMSEDISIADIRPIFVYIRWLRIIMLVSCSLDVQVHATRNHTT